jgi:hypothetical protein
MLYLTRKSNIIEKFAKRLAKNLAQTRYILDINLIYALLKIVDFVV